MKKKTILAPWVLICVLALMSSVGLFGISVGEAQAATAADCIAGTEFDAAKAVCVPCPKGKYKDFDGADFDGEVGCQTCPYGHICEYPGTTNPEICKPNTAASFDQTVCINCSTGFHSSEASQCTDKTNAMSSCCQPN